LKSEERTNDNEVTQERIKAVIDELSQTTRQFENESPRQAESHQQQLLQQMSAAAEAWNWKGWGLYIIGKFDEAIKYYDKAVEIDSNNIYGWIGKCWSNFALGKIAEIIEFSNEFIDKRSESAWIAKIWSNLVLGKAGKSLEDYEKYLKLRRNGQLQITADGGISSSVEWGFKAYLFNLLEKFDVAIKCVDKAIELDPFYDFALAFKAKILNSMGGYDNAIQYCDKVIDKGQYGLGCGLSPPYSNVLLAYALTIKGNALSGLARYDEAIKCYDKALEINPNWPIVVLFNKNGILFSNDSAAHAWLERINAISNLDIKAILEIHDKFLENGPNNVYVWTSKGDIIFNTGKFEEAIKCYDKALEINPNYALAQTNKHIITDNLDKKHKEL